MKRLISFLLCVLLSSPAQAGSDPCSEGALWSATQKLEADGFARLNEPARKAYLLKQNRELLATLHFFNSIRGVYKNPFDFTKGEFKGDYRARLNRSAMTLKGFVGNDKASATFQALENSRSLEQLQALSGDARGLTVIAGGGAVILLGVGGFFSGGATWAFIPATLGVTGAVGGATSVVDGASELGKLASAHQIEQAYPVVFAGLEGTRQFLEKEYKSLSGIEGPEAEGARALIEAVMMRIKILMKSVFVRANDFRALTSYYQSGDLKLVLKTIEPLIRQGIRAIADSYGVGEVYDAANAIVSAASEVRTRITQDSESELSALLARYQGFVESNVGAFPIGTHYSEAQRLRSFGGVISRQDLCLLAQYKALKRVTELPYLTRIEHIASSRNDAGYVKWALDRRNMLERTNDSFNDMNHAGQEFMNGLLGF